VPHLSSASTGWTELQERILKALEEKALTLDALAEQLQVERSQLYRDGIKELKEHGRIKNHRRIGGYYRRDRPPPKYAELLRSDQAEVK
jgi:predicted transcriptional regulator